MTFCRAGFKARKRPSSVSLNFPLRFLSPYQEAIRAISTQGRSFSSARQKPFRGVDLGKQDPKSKLLVKTSTARRSSPAFLRRSRTFNTVRSAVKQLLRGASSSQALRRIFVEPQRCFGIDRKESPRNPPRPPRQFSDPSV